MTTAEPLVPDQNPPRPFDITKPEEQRRLFRELRGYISTCRNQHHGTDRAGRMHAMEALDRIVALELRLSL